MRLVYSLRSWSLGMATASFVMAGAVTTYAAPSVSPHAAVQGEVSSQSTSSMSHSWRLVGVNAHLEHSISASSAHPGQEVMAKLNGAVTTTSGIHLGRGTVLMGKVVQASSSRHHGPSRISIVFTRAKLHNGREIPVKVTVLSASHGSSYGWGLGSSSLLGPAPRHVSSKETVNQQPGLISGVSMQSSVQGHNSATFFRKKGNIRLIAGTNLQLGIAAHGSHGMHNGAMKSGQHGA